MTTVDGATTAGPVDLRSEDDEDTGVETEQAQRIFSTSILVSAVRCTLTYVILPFVLPFAGFADWGARIGVIIGAVAIIANVVSIRRMHRADHHLKLPVTFINLAMIGLVGYLVFDDVRTLLG